ncbi:barstar family protein [Methanobrevibacter olleyae]|uniref:Barstar (Barnase inhibitor) n=1 Tax=Methanobrevibacter olleyae TaxID=294671 RepID=A0A126R2H6_METOL|nr:barstar family protein [Methanobrevibacter olleyae]AMK16244.1 ribonuclease inhibitor [Methanobrevibacter olleyae]SFL61254.1 Barstar (barnase inhibitor) [Methanobrevibacter olleyae]
MTNKILENRGLRKKLKKMIDNMNEIVLYGKEMKENPHEYIKEKLDFPDYYGENLDALFDCLSELYNKTIIIKDSSALDDNLLATFKDASRENLDLNLILD